MKLKTTLMFLLLLDHYYNYYHGSICLSAAAAAAAEIENVMNTNNNDDNDNDNDNYNNQQQQSNGNKNNNNKKKQSQRIAVIGGGISGTFVSKYLVDLDSTNCQMDELTLFDPNPIGQPIYQQQQQQQQQNSNNKNNIIQQSRVGTLQLQDGRIIELGASVLSEKFHFIMEMAQSGNLTIGRPFDTNTGIVDTNMRKGMAVWNFRGNIALNTVHMTDPFWKKIALLWRYNIDLIRINTAMAHAISKFEQLQDLVKQPNNHFFESPYEMWKTIGLDDMIRVSLDEYCEKILGVPDYIPTWRKWISWALSLVTSENIMIGYNSTTSSTSTSTSTNTNTRGKNSNMKQQQETKQQNDDNYYQGILRKELLSAINLVNYNQDTSQVNAMAGLASFSVAAGGKIYGIKGGNYQIVRSAWEQAIQNQKQNCHPNKHDHNNNNNNNDYYKERIHYSQQRISTVVGHLNGFELYNEHGKLIQNNDDNGGDLYDIVILAAPYTMAGIDFLVKSHIDESVLQPMSLGGLVTSFDDHYYNNNDADLYFDKNNNNNNKQKLIPEGHEGHFPLPKDIAKSARLPYTQIVTTIVKHGTIQTEYFGFDSSDDLPRGIYMTPTGKTQTESNITAIAQIASNDGLYKIFSSYPVSHSELVQFFGPSVTVEFEQIWGGRHGGAAPNYQGIRNAATTNTRRFYNNHNDNPDDDKIIFGTPFLLYDGAIGFHGHTKSGALYYPNSFELTFACTEASAMGSKAVAKLIAKRFGWKSTENNNEFQAGSEL